MLATRGMGSYHGQDAGLPFGYNENIEGVAFPPGYGPHIPPPAPQGKPLLNLSDQEELDGFFAGFDNIFASENLPASAPDILSGNLAATNEPSLAPQYFITSHTHMQGQPPFIDPNTLIGGGGMFDGNPSVGNMPIITNTLPFDQMAQHSIQTLPLGMPQNQPDNSDDFFDPLKTAIHNNYPVSWSHGLPPTNNIHSSDSRPVVRFGSDSHFQPSGYIPPPGAADLGEQNGIQRLDWLEREAQSSAANTQPNTQPSSPIWSRKRRDEDLLSTEKDQPNYLAANVKPVEVGQNEGCDPSASYGRKKRKVTQKTQPKSHIPRERPSFINTNVSPTTPIATSTATTNPDNRSKRETNNYQNQTPTPTQTCFPTETPTSSNSGTPFRRFHSGSSSHNHGGSRIPLTTDQKRANHTNSEQRRRDQTQKAFARLFDLVPDLERQGKISQMKRLERVVMKVRELEDGNHECRRRIRRLEERGKWKGKREGQLDGEDEVMERQQNMDGRERFEPRKGNNGVEDDDRDGGEDENEDEDGDGDGDEEQEQEQDEDEDDPDDQEDQEEPGG